MFRKLISIFIVSSLMCFLFISCSKKSDDSSDPGKEVPALPGGEGLSSSIKLLKEQFKQVQNDVVVSGLSVDFATAMLANGATGETLQELETFLEVTKDAKTNALSGMLENIKYSKTIEIANGIWGNQFQEQFKEDMKNKFNADAEPLPSNTKTINEWIAKKTHNKIQKMLEEGPTNPASSYLANTIFYKGFWASKFDKADTIDREFTTLEGSLIQVPTMSQGDMKVEYAEDEDMESVKIAYKNGGTMSIFLPKEGKDFATFIQELSKDKLLNMEYRNRELRVRIPKFEIESDIDVKAIMQYLNVTKIFDSNTAELTGMTKVASYVESIQQKAVIKVDEEGTEAAAATVVGAKASAIGADPEFWANRPFVFYVSEGDFLGVYTGKSK